jgi:hypothetical protein
MSVELKPKRADWALSRKCYASVALMPKVNSAKCHGENRVFIHPVCALDGCRFMVNEGWRVLGWCDAPTKGTGPHAIVYEKLSPSVFEGPRFGVVLSTQPLSREYTGGMETPKDAVLPNASGRT